MIATRKRVPALFRWDVRDGLGANGKLVARSYGSELEGVFTRAGVKYVADKNGLLIPVAHSTPAFGYVHDADGALVQGLLTGPSRTNLVTRSQEFDNAAWAKAPGVTVTANAATAPDGTATMDLLTSDGSGALQLLSQSVTFTGDGEKCFSVFLRQGTAAITEFGLYDSTAIVHRHRVGVSWNSGIPSLATQTGAGTRYAPVWYYNDGWRVSASATGIVAANANIIALYPAGVAAVAGTVYAWGAQAENAVEPSSYIQTGATAVTRAADSLYFPFTALPQEMTAYVKGVEQSRANATPAADSGILHIGSAANTDPRFLVYRSSLGAGYRAQHDTGAGVAAGPVATTAARGDTVELRAVLASDGAVTVGASLNGGAEATGGPTAALALGAAWSDTRLYLNSIGSIAPGAFAFESVVIAAGTKTMDEMRALAEVD